MRANRFVSPPSGARSSMDREFPFRTTPIPAASFAEGEASARPGDTGQEIPHASARGVALSSAQSNSSSSTK
ncbi:hypothetical protein JCM2811A_02160 [Methylorubrum rhodinum]